MGLINELHDIRAEMTYKERQRLERENKKTLQENYKKEIIGNLQAEFYNLFDTLSYREAYKRAILEKESIVDRITNFIESLTYKKNNKKYYLYKAKFDIVQDLRENYYKILNQIQKDYKNITEIQEAETLEKLKSYLLARFENAERLQSAINILSQSKYINLVIDEVTQDEQEKDIIQQNYYKILNEVIKQYKYSIQEEKQQEKAMIRAERERQKIKRRDRLALLYLINKWLK